MFQPLGASYLNTTPRRAPDMDDGGPDPRILAAGVQTTLLAVSLLLLSDSIGTLSRRTTDVFVGLSLLCAMGGTALVTFGINR